MQIIELFLPIIYIFKKMMNLINSKTDRRFAFSKSSKCRFTMVKTTLTLLNLSPSTLKIKKVCFFFNFWKRGGWNWEWSRKIALKLDWRALFLILRPSDNLLLITDLKLCNVFYNSFTAFEGKHQQLECSRNFWKFKML